MNQLSTVSSSQMIPRTQQELPAYPLKCFPPVINNVIYALHDETQIPVELISSVVLTATSLACQSLVEVIPPYHNSPEPCSLYLLTIAESGQGKTTISKQVMKPFYDFASEMKQEYEALLSDYKREHKIWKVKQQALDNNLRQAIKKGYSGEEEEEKINEHVVTEPPKPARPVIIYEDTSLKALVEGLSEYSEAGFISDEAITFFKSHIKNNPGLLNKAWDGGAYDFRRADGEIYELTPRLTFSLMAQPGVFMEYLRKHGDIARSSGFLSRFLFAWINSATEQRNENTRYGHSAHALNVFHERIKTLLAQQKANFYNNNICKKRLTLTEEAGIRFKSKYAYAKHHMEQGKAWYHIRDIVSKSGANALRLAAILQHFHDDSMETISEDNLGYAYEIMDWYIKQAGVLFYPMSEQYQFEQDVRELYIWIRARFRKNNGYPFLKNEIEKYGPHRLRRTERLTPILDQLISQRGIGIVQANPGAALYVSKEIQNSLFMPPPVPLPYNRFNVVQSWQNTSGRAIPVDLSGL